MQEIERIQIKKRKKKKELDWKTWEELKIREKQMLEIGRKNIEKLEREKLENLKIKETWKMEKLGGELERLEILEIKRIATEKN